MATDIVLTLRRAGHEAYFVGGCVRDVVRGVEPEDYDIATSARPDEVRSIFPHTVPVGEAFGVLLVVEADRKYEVATYRTEHGYHDGRRPSEVAFATAAEDVRRRDFTVNGLLMDPVTGEITDHVGGREDIARRIIRTIGDPDERFAEDHLRMLRAVRFAANLGFEIDPETLAAVSRNARSVSRVSGERVRDEITKLLTSRRGRGGARRGMELLAETGLLAEVLPEADAMRGVEQPPRFHPEGDVWEHTLRMLDAMPPALGPIETESNKDAQDLQDGERQESRPSCPSFSSLSGLTRLAWGVVMHDIGKPVTRTEDSDGVHFYDHTRKGVEIAERAMRRLRFPTADIDAVKGLVHHHMRFMHVTEMRPNKLKRLLRMPDFDLHLELHRLDCASSHGKLDNYEFCLRKLDEFGEEELKPPRLVTGKDLIAMGFAPGPLFGQILTAVEDAQLDGRIASPEEARTVVLEGWGDRRI